MWSGMWWDSHYSVGRRDVAIIYSSFTSSRDRFIGDASPAGPSCAGAFRGLRRGLRRGTTTSSGSECTAAASWIHSIA